MPGPDLFDKLEEIERKLRRVDIVGGGGGTIQYVYQTFAFSYEGDVTEGSYGVRFYVRGTYTIDKVRLSLNTAPDTQSCIADVHKNGVTIFTTQGNRPTVVAGSSYDDGTPDITALADGDYLEAYIDQGDGLGPVVHVYVKQQAWSI